MRTIFEDTTLKADLEESRIRGNESKSTLPILWFIALLFLGGVGGVTYWVTNHPAVAPPAPPVSLEDPKQRAEAFNKFNLSIINGNWLEAEGMISTPAKQRLTSEQKSLPESMLGKFKDYKIVGGEMTQSIDTTVPGMVRLDCLYKFTDDPVNYTKIEERIISLTIVIENGRLVIDNWEGAGSEVLKEESGNNSAVSK